MSDVTTYINFLQNPNATKLSLLSAVQDISDEQFNTVTPVLTSSTERFPGIKEMAFNLSETTRQSIAGFFRTGTMFASKDIIDQRMNQCAACDKLIPKTCRCSMCGCYMNTKVRILHSSCPIHKW
jgi:hypothetical protein